MKSKVLSIYLPQFHTIPENDAWWGTGFTEWTNVKRGQPYYPGHYQPREPLYDNYYDLSDLKVLEKHTRMARKAGIAGFCFYHYYFNGKKLLERPIENYRDKSKEKFPYCLIWANQSWERTWHGLSSGKPVLIQQRYGGEDDWREHFYYLLDFFKDRRYIKINNKPVYIIYIPQSINLSYRRKMFALWQDMAKEYGFDGIYLIAMKTSYGHDSDSSLYDAYMDFEPLNTFRIDKSWRKYLQIYKEKHIEKFKKRQCVLQNRIWAKNTYSYSYLCRKIEKRAKISDNKTFYGIFAGWDNTARKDETGIIVHGSNPLRFRNHLKKMLELSEKNGKEYIFLNAWNEWSEGAYIEPDKKYGYQYLQALRDAICRYGQKGLA